MLLAANTMIVVKMIAKRTHFMVLSFYYAVSGIIYFNFYVFFIQDSYVRPSYRDILIMIAIIITGFFDQVLRVLALRNAPAFIVSVVASAQIFFGFIFDITIFNNVPNTWTIFGVILIVGSVITGVLKKRP